MLFQVFKNGTVYKAKDDGNGGRFAVMQNGTLVSIREDGIHECGNDFYYVIGSAQTWTVVRYTWEGKLKSTQWFDTCSEAVKTARRMRDTQSGEHPDKFIIHHWNYRKTEHETVPFDLRTSPANSLIYRGVKGS